MRLILGVIQVNSSDIIVKTALKGIMKKRVQGKYGRHQILVNLKHKLVFQETLAERLGNSSEK